METIVTVFLIIILFFSWLSIFFGIFGTFLILGFSFIYALITNFSIITPKVLLGLGILYLAGEVFDFVFIAWGARRFGATHRAIWGGILGGIIGAGLSLGTLGIGIFPLTLLGIFLGAFLGEFLNKKDLGKSLKAGIGSILGRFTAILFKVFIGLIMIFIVIRQIINFFH